ncbi:Uncharacterised protein [Segatella copri]|nr:Uncharacterised protein [Segatella copri]
MKMNGRSSVVRSMSISSPLSPLVTSYSAYETTINLFLLFVSISIFIFYYFFFFSECLRSLPSPCAPDR